MISMILAMGNDKLVGKSDTKNGLPWHYKEDLAYYKKMTINKKNIMGRVTYQAIGFPLPNRDTYVLTNDIDLKIEGVTVINDYKKALEFKDEEVMIIGGVKIFELYFPHVDRIYLTKINKDYTGDCYYESFNLENFGLTSTEKILDGEVEFQVWDRI